jgi:hypothetical protein
MQGCDWARGTGKELESISIPEGEGVWQKWRSTSCKRHDAGDVRQDSAFQRLSSMSTITSVCLPHTLCAVRHKNRIYCGGNIVVPRTSKKESASGLPFPSSPGLCSTVWTLLSCQCMWGAPCHKDAACVAAPDAGFPAHSETNISEHFRIFPNQSWTC